MTYCGNPHLSGLIYAVIEGHLLPFLISTQRGLFDEQLEKVHNLLGHNSL